MPHVLGTRQAALIIKLGQAIVAGSSGKNLKAPTTIRFDQSSVARELGQEIHFEARL
jgi:hypothetical protein